MLTLIVIKENYYSVNLVVDFKKAVLDLMV